MKILVSVPNTGWVHKSIVFSVIKILQDQRHKSTLILPTHNPFENNLHHIIIDFLKGDYDFWLSIDSDNPPINNPLDLVSLNKDIIGLPTPVWHFDQKNKKKGESPIYWNGYKKQDDGYTEWSEKKGLQKVDAVGTGCFLVARRVFENKKMQSAPFERKLYPDGRVNKGNDISFCERASENGFEIYCHYDYPCMHFNEIELNEVFRAFYNMYTK